MEQGQIRRKSQLRSGSNINNSLHFKVIKLALALFSGLFQVMGSPLLLHVPAINRKIPVPYVIL